MDTSSLPRPTTPADLEGWKAYWISHNEPWRTEPEIATARQRELAARRDTITPDTNQNIYPFREIRLTRADIEWLLATHESQGIVGPVLWGSAEHQFRVGLDLRGADLSGLDLSYLPLTRLQGGLSRATFRQASLPQLQKAAINLNQTSLIFTLLEESTLTFASLAGADLQSAHLEGAGLYHADFAAPQPANLRRVSFDSNTVLNRVTLTNAAGVGPYLGDVHWNGAIISAINWRYLKKVAEEQEAASNSDKKAWDDAKNRFLSPTRTYRQLAVMLREQGMQEEADRFAYKAKTCLRRLLWNQGNIIGALGSGFLDMLAGYGYHVWKSILWYVGIIGVFALCFSLVNPASAGLGSVIDSILSFHGRGLAPNTNFAATSPIVVLSAVEAIIGFLIEISFIATFTQRFFSR